MKSHLAFWLSENLKEMLDVMPLCGVLMPNNYCLGHCLSLGLLLIFKVRTGIYQNKPRPAQVGAMSTAQKQQKDFKVSKYSLIQYPKNLKVGPNWRARGDPLRFSSILSQIIKKMKGGPFGENNFLKNSHNAEKTERADSLGFFNIHSVAKLQKKFNGSLWRKFFGKKILNAGKKLKGGPFILAQYCMLRGKK